MDDRSLAQTEDEVRERLQRDLRSVPVAPYAQYRARAEERTQRRASSLPVAALATALVVILALALGLALADARRNVAGQRTPSPSASPPAASPTPSASAAPTPTPLPSGRPAGGIEAYPLGPLHGDYAFVLNGGANTLPGAVAEVWAVPLGGGSARLAARYVNAVTPSTNTGANVLARQFSPDGRKLVLSAATSRAAGGEHLVLFIVDLETGRIQAVGSEDAADHERPRWSPDGKRLVYVRRPILGDGRTGGPDDGIWVMSVDGSAARKMPLTPGPESHVGPPQVELYSWTPDGRVAWFWPSLENILTFTDVDTGIHTQIRSGVGDVRGLSFRTAAPRVAGSFSDRPGNCPGNFVAVLDGAPERVLVRETGGIQCPPRVHDVHWSPSRDEVLYVREAAPKGELHIRDLSGADQRIAADAEPVLPEWSPDGSHVIYIARTVQPQFVLPLRGDDLRSIARDGSGDRVMFVPPRDPALSDVATRTYP